MIKFNNVSFKYPNFCMKDLNFEIKKGEVVAITGNNANGKTTIIKLISGAIKAKTGEIIFDQPINFNSKSKNKIRIGIVFQNPDSQIIFNNVYDDICFTLRNFNIDKKEFDNRVDYALSLVKMTEFKHTDTYTLSTGQKQRIAIANMLAIKPDLIIFDEASAYLDASTKQALYSLFKDLKSQGITVIYTTNLIEEIVYADRVMVLDKGEMKAFLPIAEMLKNLNIFRENGTYIPLKLRIIEKFGLKEVEDDRILNQLGVK